MTHDEWKAHLELLGAIERGRKAEKRREEIATSVMLLAFCIVAIVVTINMFGNPERVADFVITECPYDCLSCPFNGTVCDYGDCWRKEPDKWRAGIIERLSSSTEM